MLPPAGIPSNVIPPSTSAIFHILLLSPIPSSQRPQPSWRTSSTWHPDNCSGLGSLPLGGRGRVGPAVRFPRLLSSQRCCCPFGGGRFDPSFLTQAPHPPDPLLRPPPLPLNKLRIRNSGFACLQSLHTETSPPPRGAPIQPRGAPPPTGEKGGVSCGNGKRLLLLRRWGICLPASLFLQLRDGARALRKLRCVWREPPPHSPES